MLPTEDPRFLIAVRGEDEGNRTSSAASNSHGPLDLPFPPKTHDMSRSMRSLLNDVQDDFDEPKKLDPKPQPAAPRQRA